MASLLRRYRALLASVSDNWFDENDLIDHLNDAKNTIISTAINLELDQPKYEGKTIRALNNLRTEKTIDTLSFSAYNDFYTVEIPVNDVDEEKLLYINGNIDGESFIMTEITHRRRYEIDLGLLKPSLKQAYWLFVKDSSGDNVIRTYINSNDANTEISVTYISDHAPISEQDESLEDLPDRLIKPVVLRAAIDGANMEVRENADSYLALYQNELETHLW